MLYKSLLNIAFLSVVCVSMAHSKMITFNDLDVDLGSYDLAGSGYGGVLWGEKTKGYQDNFGGWAVVNDVRNNNPRSGNNVINQWGASFLAISFSELVNISGAYIATQGFQQPYSNKLRVYGYQNDKLVSQTGWYDEIVSNASWFAMGLESVDRIVFESININTGFGWFGMDDLTFEAVDGDYQGYASLPEPQLIPKVVEPEPVEPEPVEPPAEVPLPATFWLFSSAISLLILKRKIT